MSTPPPPPVPPAGFGLELTRQALRDLRRLDRPIRERVFTALVRLVRYELDIEAELLIVLRVLPRGRAYRD